MPIDIKMPALSPTMEEGTLARWLVKPGDTVRSGDLIAEIETDKATMEFEAVDEGVVGEILVDAGTDGVKVGAVIATILADGEEPGTTARATDAAPAAPAATAAKPSAVVPPAAKAEASAATSTAPPAPAAAPQAADGAGSASPASSGGRVKASPLARRIARDQGVAIDGLTGTGPGGRIVKADVLAAAGRPQGAAASAPASAPAADPAPATVASPAPASAPVGQLSAAPTFASDTPHRSEKMSSMRRTIARRLTEAKQTVPHIYLTLDIRIDALLKLRAELNAALEAQGIKLSVNDLLIKALARSLAQVPECNVSVAGDQLIRYDRVDIAVAVSVPAGLITPIITAADTKSVSAIATEMKALAARSRDGKLQPHEYQGGTASLSNMGMFGITQFDAVINPPQGMILAVGAGEQRPVVTNGGLAVATVMTVTGSFDHRAIDGADGARQMQALKQLCEAPLGLVA